MSDTDKYRPSSKTVIVQVKQQFVPVSLRRVVQGENNDRRTARAAGARRREQMSQDIMREQVQDALFSAPYTGPVGTKTPEWERILLHTHSMDCLAGAHEVRITDCEFGCKVYATSECGELILHSSVYGHTTYSVEAAPKVQHIVPKRDRMVRKSVQELREEVRKVRASREREAEMIERAAREHGFGARMSGVQGL